LGNPHPQIIIYDASSAVILAGETAVAKLDVLVDHINSVNLMGGNFFPAVQKCTGYVQGIAFFSLGASVENKNFHIYAPVIG
jgi:hypothetical protein